MILGDHEGKAFIVIGAGATRGSYLGIGKAKIRPPLNADFFKVAKKFVGTMEGRPLQGAFQRLERFVDSEMRLRLTDSYTMEEVFNVLFMSKELPRIFTQGGRPRDAGYRREIRDFFQVVVGLLRHVQMNPRNPKGLDHHGLLAGSLQPGDTVLSLNYDTLMDNALLSFGWDPRSGYGFNAQDKVRYSALEYTGGLKDVLLLKPHGSLNWFAKGTMRSYELALTGKRPSTVVMSPVPRAYNSSRAEVRFFIPPLYTKFFANPFWRSMWYQTYRRLLDARMLVVVGCSLIETDFHLRAILGRALERRSSKFERIIIVTPDPRKLRMFFRGRARQASESHKDFTTFVSTELT